MPRLSDGQILDIARAMAFTDLAEAPPPDVLLAFTRHHTDGVSADDLLKSSPNESHRRQLSQLFGGRRFREVCMADWSRELANVGCHYLAEKSANKKVIVMGDDNRLDYREPHPSEGNFTPGEIMEAVLSANARTEAWFNKVKKREDQNANHT